MLGVIHARPFTLHFDEYLGVVNRRFLYCFICRKYWYSTSTAANTCIDTFNTHLVNSHGFVSVQVV